MLTKNYLWLLCGRTILELTNDLPTKSQHLCTACTITDKRINQQQQQQHHLLATDLASYSHTTHTQFVVGFLRYVPATNEKTRSDC